MFSKSAAGTFLRFLVVFPLTLCFGYAVAQSSGGQSAAEGWSPTVVNPEFPRGDGPTILVDAAHGNFHTINGRFSPFAELLNLDGYQTESADTEVTTQLLASASVFVISNAVYGGDEANWVLPTHPAFTTEEIDTIVTWVRDGGSLLLIADHMPFPGSTADLASKFGIVFLNGYAKRSAREGGTLSFTRSSGSLADHTVTQGRSESERIESITSFTGQAFRIVTDAEPLMHMPDDWEVYFPTEAGLIGIATPAVSAKGLVQGAVLRFGSGRVAIFGEAAMFTAQTRDRGGGEVGKMGMNHPSAEENAQFVLNVVHWLTARLDD